MKARVLITGDSHVGAIKLGAILLRDGGEAPQGAEALDLDIMPLGSGALMSQPFSERSRRHVAITNPKLHFRDVDRIPKAGETLDAVGLCMALWPLRTMRLLARDGFSHPELLPGRAFVSRAVLRQALIEDHRHIMAFAGQLGEIGIRVFAVAAPGIFRDNSILKEWPDYAPVAGHLYEACQEILVEEYARIGVPSILGPEDAVDDEGYTIGAYRSGREGDTHHANAAWGAIVARNLYREIAAPTPGHITKVGLRTFVDPRLEGGKLNAVTQEDLVSVVELGAPMIAPETAPRPTSA